VARRSRARPLLLRCGDDLWRQSLSVLAPCDRLTGVGPGSVGSRALHDALARLSELSRPYIQLQETQFTREALDAVWGAERKVQFGKAIAEHVQQHIDPEEMQSGRAILLGISSESRSHP
jgi:hypothetical protein